MTNSSISTKKSKIQGVELHVQGIVQGVGFRPFIYNLAVQLNISGTVSNTSAGVFIQAAGCKRTLDTFVTMIKTKAPPLAQILAIDIQSLDPGLIEKSGFRIIASDGQQSSSTAIPPDIALCDDCLTELLSPDDRRHSYPFINCTNCGPRFTIIETIPYDRPQTSMKVFPMCPACQREYDDPADRRFHAQPNACESCGPEVSWHHHTGVRIDCSDPIAAAAKALAEDKVLAIRGLGGFHLCVNAYSEAAVSLLRSRKNRPTKPLAVMVPDVEAVKMFCALTPEEEEKLKSPEHPIVLLRKKRGTELARNLCPGVSDIGIMLPYTPLHHLLFNQPDCPSALVMTSGNKSGHPICISNKAALQQLSHIVDNYLFHNREILTRVDDSVTKRMQGAFRLFRRARGFSPAPLLLSHELPPVLGLGAGLKSTFCLSRGSLGFLSQHIGDLFNLESYDFFIESVNHHKKVFEIEPEIAVRDLHPDYLSSHYADSLDIPVYTAQHHHAHAVAVMAEHNISAPVIAVVLDGTGYGTDGTIWGGEILLSRLTDFTRLGHLQQLPLAGGDKAAEEPWRMALAALYHTYGRDWLAAPENMPKPLQRIEKSRRDILISMVENEFNCPKTSSCGRLFDSIAALLDIRLHSDYEGHAAMELETLAWEAAGDDWKMSMDSSMKEKESPFLRPNEGKWEIISTEFVKMVVDKTTEGFKVSQIALDFHLELICAISKLTNQLSVQHKTDKVVLSGGCMQNRLLMEGLFYNLEKMGLRVFTGEKVPVNDGGISFGQIIIGGLQHVSSNSHESHPGIG